MDLLVFRRLAACVAGDAIRHPTPTPPLKWEGSWMEPFPLKGRGVWTAVTERRYKKSVIKGFWYQFLMNSIFFSQKNSSIKKKTLYLPNRRKRQMN